MMVARSLVSSSVLADVVAVAAGIDQPVQVPQVVPGLVFAMAGKLDREAAADRAVLAGQDALDGLARGDAQIAQPLDDLLLDLLGRVAVMSAVPRVLKVGHAGARSGGRW